MLNPFEQQLRLHRPGPQKGAALEAPLPLGTTSAEGSGEDGLRLFDCDLGPLQIIAASGPGRRQQLIARPWISLLYVVWGEIVIVQSGLHLSGSAGACLLLPQSPAMWQSEEFSVVCLMLMPHRLAELMHPPVEAVNSESVCPTAQLTAHVFQRERGVRERQLLELLATDLRAVAALHNDAPHLIDHLLLSDQLVRIIAAMASASTTNQRCQEPHQRRRPAGMQETLDELIAFIQANLDQPLNLQILEQQTHYSRRALQYAFRKRLGCTASQWIRTQRLDLAYQQLQQAAADDSVSSIAQRCGYHSISLFSIDFQQRFHIKPSHLLRKRLQQP
jgi:AraC-like DNA-binding protein